MGGDGESNFGGGGGDEGVVAEVLGEEAYDAAVEDAERISTCGHNVALHIHIVDEPFALQSFPIPSSPTYSKTSSTQFHTSSSNNSSSVVSFPPFPSPLPTTNHSRYRFAASALVFRSSERMASSSAFCVSFSRSAALSLPRPAAPVALRCRVGCEDVSNCIIRCSNASMTTRV